MGHVRDVECCEVVLAKLPDEVLQVTHTTGCCRPAGPLAFSRWRWRPHLPRAAGAVSCCTTPRGSGPPKALRRSSALAVEVLCRAAVSALGGMATTLDPGKGTPAHSRLTRRRLSSVWRRHGPSGSVVTPTLDAAPSLPGKQLVAQELQDHGSTHLMHCRAMEVASCICFLLAPAVEAPAS